MHNAIQLLSIYILIGNNAGKRGHKNGRDAHGGEDSAELREAPMFILRTVGTDGNEPGAPDKKLHKVHRYQAKLNIHTALD
ncbi:hypothetical protein GCM10027037_09600 [Mucilaginibacter koreensis]